MVDVFVRNFTLEKLKEPLGLPKENQCCAYCRMARICRGIEHFGFYPSGGAYEILRTQKLRPEGTMAETRLASASSSVRCWFMTHELRGTALLFINASCIYYVLADYVFRLRNLRPCTVYHAHKKETKQNLASYLCSNKVSQSCRIAVSWI